MKRFFALVAVGLAVAATAAPSQASIVVYNNQASFNAATTGLTSVNFVGLAPPGGFTYYGNTLTTGGLTFTDVGARLFVIDPGFSPPSWSYTPGRPVLTDNFGGGAGLTTTAFPAGTTAVSFTIGDFGPTTATITLSTGDVVNLNLAGQPNLDFIGFTSTIPITSVTIQDGIQAPVIDTVQFGQAIPEPATFAVFGVLAFGALGARRRLKVA